jgi:phage terminase large subunit
MRYGLDFGFGVDPAAFNATLYDKGKRTLYILAEFQGRELSNENLAQIMRPIVGDGVVYCDSAEPKSIKELRSFGIHATPAKKGKGSIEHGIKWLQAQTIIIDESCVNTANEFSLYSWKKDKYGEPLPVPEDTNNHHIDELRYQYEDMAAANSFSVSKYA